MPLIHSSSEPAFRTNVKNLMHEAKAGTSAHVKSPAQALAISYAIKRRGRAYGGRTHFDIGGFINPAAAPVSGPAAMAAPSPGVAPMPVPMPAPVLGPTQTTPTAPMPAQPMPAQPAGSLGGFGQMPAQSPMMGAGSIGGFGGYPPPPMPSGTSMGMQRGGVPHRALGGPPAMPWFARNEARGMTHTGPINSIVPGRTDHIPMKVPAGSYVLPADHISSLGQGNTAAGHAVVNHMFGSGPFGMGAMKMGHGPGAPRPPKLMGIRASGGRSDAGGARGDNTGTPTDIIAAGGEHVLTPEQVMHVGGGDLHRGHKILDAWVVSNRKKHVKTLSSLPGPAKS